MDKVPFHNCGRDTYNSFPTMNGKSVASEFEEEDKIPSDFTIDHHPHRTCAYALTFVDSDQEQQPSSEVDEDDMKWVIGDTCISSLCFELKTSTTQIIRHLDPAQVSDIRILILNDIFIFDKNPAHSVSQYFNNDVHKIIKPTLLFDTADLTRGMNCYNWCQEIETCPPPPMTGLRPYPYAPNCSPLHANLGIFSICILPRY
ncbi:uncharacterized protein EV154DRAFT_253772 [Mucor mucedo]|uniref:uncharacterized protein n=1 Tax=Mucor mucedo TaxID=29922 RepID=UPI00221ED0C5|nr:uncharacterized protein EV154DRAFT_253772 [Mucor mucedo]KAI7890344.1 hypothetical protein EV154DRAFT_253772 [Mucor mucedo]